MTYRPTSPQLVVETFLKRYEKNQSKPSRTATDSSSSSDRRRSRRDDPARIERRQQKLSASYKAAIGQVEELAAAQAMVNLISDAGLITIQRWLPTNATGAYVGLCTLGEALDDHIRELTSSDLAAAAVLNEVALAWIVAITKEMRLRVGAEVQVDGARVGAAYRPGLGRWPLEVQKTVFTELPTETIGVMLTESLLMLPSFSTSLVIPIIPDVEEA